MRIKNALILKPASDLMLRRIPEVVRDFHRAGLTRDSVLGDGSTEVEPDGSLRISLSFTTNGEERTVTLAIVPQDQWQYLHEEQAA